MRRLAAAGSQLPPGGGKSRSRSVAASNYVLGYLCIYASLQCGYVSCLEFAICHCHSHSHRHSLCRLTFSIENCIWTMLDDAISLEFSTASLCWTRGSNLFFSVYFLRILHSFGDGVGKLLQLGIATRQRRKPARSWPKKSVSSFRQRSSTSQIVWHPLDAALG